MGASEKDSSTAGRPVRDRFILAGYRSALERIAKALRMTGCPSLIFDVPAEVERRLSGVVDLNVCIPLRGVVQYQASRPWDQVITGWKLALRVTWQEVAGHCDLTMDHIDRIASDLAECSDEDARAIMGAMLSAWRER